ncbi:hypothetical protein [Streptomyces sp. SP18CS02]|uniref:hypothetical protein n=1 Tax=Streptomyces sp. SP18CS02 TaxID=3002531 RepID=UPI002E7A8F8C|nr:hypothetical protein [Streptomyces sp. SP18CS02]MEE1752850.1 hypothetical protein [Streptomyces sp. SP18CS02]
MTGREKGRVFTRRLPPVATALLGAASSVIMLASCSTDEGNGSRPPASPRPTAPNTSSFTGSPPSAMASAAASVVESARAAASAAASSASAAASAFEASVSAEAVRANAAAAAELKKVQGRGNATSDVSLTGRPTADTSGLRVVVVNITNRTEQQASYAVQVDFTDSSGKAVETRIVGAQDLAPGEKAQPLAISRKPADLKLTPVIAKAQRY